MKKTFLILGTLACISATNAYANIVISQEQESPDVTITVARVADKIGKRGSTSTQNNQQQSQDTTSKTKRVMTKTSYSCPSEPDGAVCVYKSDDDGGRCVNAVTGERCVHLPSVQIETVER